MRRDGLKHRLGRRGLAVEPLQRLAPPREPHPGHHRLAAGGEHRAQSDVKTPERFQCVPRGGGDVGECKLAVGVEGAAQR